jgi:hypothetical protein
MCATRRAHGPLTTRASHSCQVQITRRMRPVDDEVGVVRGRDLVHGIKHRMERRDGAIHAMHALYRDERPALACLRTGHSVRNPRASLRVKGRKWRGATSDARAVADQAADSGVVEEGVAELGD